MGITIRDLYAASAAILLVALGLGIIYLVVMDRLTPLVGIGALIGTGALIWALGALRNFAEASYDGAPKSRP